MIPVERVGVMMEILERIEEEGRIYVELRSRVQSQVTNVEDGPALGSDSSLL